MAQRQLPTVYIDKQNKELNFHGDFRKISGSTLCQTPHHRLTQRGVGKNEGKFRTFTSQRGIGLHADYAESDFAPTKTARGQKMKFSENPKFTQTQPEFYQHKLCLLQASPCLKKQNLFILPIRCVQFMKIISKNRVGNSLFRSCHSFTHVALLKRATRAK